MWELDYKESWVLKNWCFWTVVLEKTLESPLDCKEIHAIQPKGDQSWLFTGRTDVEAETPIFGHLMWRDDSFEDPGEGDNRGWDGWMASLTRWTCVWVNSGSWWWTGRSGVLRFMGLQRVRHDWVTELNWTECFLNDWMNVVFPAFSPTTPSEITFLSQDIYMPILPNPSVFTPFLPSLTGGHSFQAVRQRVGRGGV